MAEHRLAKSLWLRIIVFTVVILIVPVFAFAQANPPKANGCSVPEGGTSNLPACVNQIYIWSMGLAAVLALLMIVVGGYITLTAAGNAARATQGRSYITSSLVGLVLLFGAYILLRTINPDLVDFKDNCINNISTCKTTEPTPVTNPVPGT